MPAPDKLPLLINQQADLDQLCQLIATTDEVVVDTEFVRTSTYAPHLGLLRFEGREDAARAEEAMERLGIASLAERSVLELSGGERQLTMVARALCQDAELLLLDEPTAFLDLEHRLEVLEVVKELAARGRGALVVSHDLSLAARFCDRMVILAGGRVLADGTPGRVLAPELLREGFGIEAELLAASDGSPVVVPRTATRPDRA